jgi:hypothetical protein
MSLQKYKKITDVVGNLPYRIALSGGWIDQPYISRHNPSPPGSMVVVAVEPEFRFMDRSGICGSTREIALKLWNNQLPDRPPKELVQELYKAENEGKAEPSGSQDMIGIIYPGINRLDYDVTVRGGIFPSHIESNNDPDVASWLGEVIQIVSVGPRPDGYNPLGRKNFSPEWIARLGQSGKDCYDAIINKNLDVLGAAFNECMLCWHTIMPDILEHPTLKIDLLALLEYYQSRYPGAMYSGCGGGYLYVASSETVPGSFRIKVRIKNT